MKLKLLSLAVAITALSGACHPDPESQRSNCVRQALNIPALSSGVAVFSDINAAPRTIGKDWPGKLIAISHYKLRAASLTKPIVAAHIRKELLTGELQLDSKILSTINQSLGHADVDAASITIQQLLQHSAGFDRSIGLDPLWHHGKGNTNKPDCAAAADYVLRHKLQFKPGQKVVYSNAGYCLLGKLILQQGMQDPLLEKALRQPLGAAGGWISSPQVLFDRLQDTLPLSHIAGNTPNLPDGSHYDFAWRHWPENTEGATWTHFGRLPGMLSIAVTDGQERLLVAFFQGDPASVEDTSSAFNQAAWKCMQVNN